MDFKKDAAASTINTVLNIVKWSIWLGAVGLVLLFASAKHNSISDQDVALFALVVGGIGYLLGYGVERYQAAIFTSHKTELAMIGNDLNIVEEWLVSTVEEIEPRLGTLPKDSVAQLTAQSELLQEYTEFLNRLLIKLEKSELEWKDAPLAARALLIIKFIIALEWGYSNEELATKLGIDQNTARSHLLEAIDSLEQLSAKYKIPLQKFIV